MTASVPAIKRNSRKGVFFDIAPLIFPSLCFSLSVCLTAWHCIGFNVIVKVWRLRASLCGRGSLLWTCGCACKHVFVWTFLTVVMNLDVLEWCCTNIRKGGSPIIYAFSSCFFFWTEFLCSYLHHVDRNTSYLFLTVRINETWRKASSCEPPWEYLFVVIKERKGGKKPVRTLFEKKCQSSVKPGSENNAG